MDKTIDLQNIEFRTVKGLEVRAADGDGMPTIVGFAAVYNVLTELAPGRFERILPGAFAESLAAGDNVYALVSHKLDKVLGRRGAGTLVLRDDPEGLFVTITPPDTQIGRDAVTSIGRGDIDGMSVGMPRDSIRHSVVIEDGNLVASIERAGLRDVSVTTFAAYPTTSVALRCLDALAEEQASLSGRGMPAKLARQKLDLLELQC